MTYLVLGFDGTDDAAPDRRNAVRSTHLDELAPLVDAGRVVIGGAILDEGGTMRGSMMVIEADTLDDARRIVEGDVYVRSGVWVRYEIHPFKRAV